jgi:hypothetical protein
MLRCQSKATTMTPSDADLALMDNMPIDELLAFTAKQEGIENAKALIEDWKPGYWEEAADVALELERHDLDDLAATVWRYAEPLPSELTRTNPWIPPCDPGCSPHARQAAIWCNRWVMRRSQKLGVPYKELRSRYCNIEPLLRDFPKGRDDWPPDDKPGNPASIGRLLVE